MLFEYENVFLAVYFLYEKFSDVSRQLQTISAYANVWHPLVRKIVIYTLSLIPTMFSVVVDYSCQFVQSKAARMSAGLDNVLTSES